MTGRLIPRRRLLPTLAACSALAALALGCEGDRATSPFEPGAAELNLGVGAEGVTVMTQNVYVGGYVDRILTATDPNQVPVLVAITFQELMFSDVPARLGAIADEIGRTNPQLVGLQEISLVRYQSPSDAIYGGTTPATIPILDFLQILEASLAARGLDYQVAGVIENVDIELPMIVSPPPNLAFDDVRLTDYDVVLARGDVEISNVEEVSYDDFISFAGYPIHRGYVAVDATIGNRTYRFANTHLEPDDLDTRNDQAEQLIAALDGRENPVIIVGDLNTPAPYGDVYNTFLTAGYVDAWDHNVVPFAGDGLTNPHHYSLRSPTVDFYQRIDFILVRNNNPGTTVLGPVFATLWNDELGDRVATNVMGFPELIWASDHAGIFAEMRIPTLGGPAYTE